MRTLEEAVSALTPWLAEREERRIVAVRNVLSGVGGGLLLAGLSAFALVALGAHDFLIFGLPVVIFILCAWLGSRAMTSLSKEVKLGLNTRLAEAFGLTYAAKPVYPARYDMFRRHGLIPSNDRRSFEDHFSGEAHAVPFELYEAHLERRIKTKNGSRYVTCFRGVLIRISYPRTIHGVTLVTRDKGVLNALESWSKKTFSGNGLERVGLVDTRFEKAFEVYGTDQVMARYLLTPSFMERLLELETVLKGKNVRCVFDENAQEGEGEGQLLIAAETGNRFEAGSMFRPMTDPRRVTTLHGDIAQIDRIIQTVLEPAQFESADQS